MLRRPQIFAKRHQQRVISIAALIVQQHRTTVRLGDDQIRSAIPIHIRGNQGARGSQLYLVKLQLGSYIFKACGPQVA